MCRCWQYLGWSLAFGPRIPHQGASASAREGVLHPQLCLAQVLAAEVAAAGILVATVWVGVHLSWATRIPRWPWERMTEKDKSETEKDKGEGLEVQDTDRS